MHLKEKGLNRFAFYGLPASSDKRWAQEREYAFRQLVAAEQYQGVVYQGMATAPANWQYTQKPPGGLGTGLTASDRCYCCDGCTSAASATSV